MRYCKLREVTEKLPPEFSDDKTLRTIQDQAEEFLLEQKDFESPSSPPRLESEQQSGPDIPASDSYSSKLDEQRMERNDDASAAVPCINGGGSVLEESNNLSVFSTGVPQPTSGYGSRIHDSSVRVRDGERSVIEQFEHGVYVTLVVLPSGSKVFKRRRGEGALVALQQGRGRAVVTSRRDEGAVVVERRHEGEGAIVARRREGRLLSSRVAARGRKLLSSRVIARGRHRVEKGGCRHVGVVVLATSGKGVSLDRWGGEGEGFRCNCRNHSPPLKSFSLFRQWFAPEYPLRVCVQYRNHSLPLKSSIGVLH
ncbi:hypothetical protein Fmac_024799 [Flemingia macrophylla]|uniref:BRX domain-containing protein n=1 Tax=Flemingia macrophylla TaxID=520843 RepID=A0ABD1LQE1_9FABA